MPSALGNIWKLNDYDQNTIKAIIQHHNLPEITAHLLAAKNIPLDEIEQFIHPRLKNSLPDPSHFLDMDKAAQRITQAIIKQQKIVIFGDYDVDGATSTSLLQRFFKMLNIEADYYIPDRVTEGYGPNTQAIEKLSQNYNLIITVDCGTMSHEPLTRAKELNTDLIVIDHHLSSTDLPPAYAIVNPNRYDQKTPHTNLAAVGVCFILIIAINRELTKIHKIDNNKELPNPTKYQSPDILSLLDIVALGTVCDVMTLTGLNRTFVTQGLKILSKKAKYGVSALCEVAEINEQINTYHLGFLLGPRINAGGRIGKSHLGTELLTTTNSNIAQNIAKELNTLNLERKSIEQQILNEAMTMAEQIPSEAPFILLHNTEKTSWHQGVIGIIASRIKEKYNRPCAIISLENNIGKASARSITGVDLGTAVTMAKINGLLISGGGHQMAAGFTIEEQKIPEFINFINQQIGSQVKIAHQNKTLKIDANINISAINTTLLEHISLLEPYGNGNREPRFLIENVKIASYKLVGKEQNHLMIFLKDSGISASPKSIKAMYFNCFDTEIGNIILSSQNKTLSIVGKIKLNSWQGNQKAEIMIDDIMICN